MPKIFKILAIGALFWGAFWNAQATEQHIDLHELELAILDNPEALKPTLQGILQQTNKDKNPQLWINLIWAAAQAFKSPDADMLNSIREASHLAEKHQLHQQWVGIQIALMKLEDKADSAPNKEGMEKLLNATRKFQKPRLEALVKAELAYAQLYRNDMAHAINLISEALEDIKNDPESREYHSYQVHATAAVVCGFLNDDSRLRSLNNELLHLARSKNLRAILLNTLCNIISYNMAKGNAEVIRNSAELFDEAIQLADELNLQFQKAILNNQYIAYYSATQNWIKAGERADAAAKAFEEADQKIWLADTLVKKAQVAIELKNYDQALAAITRAETLFPTIYEKDHMKVLETKSRVLAGLGRHENAFAVLAEYSKKLRSTMEAEHKQQLSAKLAELGVQVEEQRNSVLEKTNAEQGRVLYYQTWIIGLGLLMFIGGSYSFWIISRQKNSLVRLNTYITSHVLERYLPPAVVQEILLGHMQHDTRPSERIITVLFVDICGFTNATERLGAEKISQVLNEFLSTMTDIIFAHDGTIDKFIGDSIMVVFGAPIAMSDSEQIAKAITTCCAMLEALRDLNQKWEAKHFGKFEIRIGVHKGPAIVGNFGSKKRSDYTAIGSTVNIAARLEKLAKPNHVVFSEVIAQGLKESEIDFVGDCELKGIDRNVKIYTLIDPSQQTRLRKSS